MAPSRPPTAEAVDPPDGLFALVTGLYAAALLSPIGVALASRLVDAPGARYGAFLAAATVATVGGAVLVRRQAGVDVRLGVRRRVWLFVLGPVAATALVFAVQWTVAPTWLSRGDLLLALGGGVGGTALGFVLVSMAKTRYVAWLLADVPVAASWTAGWPTGPRRRLQYVAGVTVVFGSLVLLLGVLFDQAAARIAGQFLVPLGAIMASVGRPRTYNVTDHGLEIRLPVARRFVPWDELDGYELDARALVLVRPGLTHASIRNDIDEIEDREAVIGALDAHLPRLA